MNDADQAQANLAGARALVAGLLQRGVDHAVISPGSRSSPLVLACDEARPLQTWIIPDERAAAFFALGLAKGCQRPIAVIATSGSAPAHWYPAVIEAAQDLQPLILISADRPPDLQGCGANQTIDQTHLFGSQVRAFFALPEAGSPSASWEYLIAVAARAVDRSHWPLPGPVHLNVPFREPLIIEPPVPKQPQHLPQPLTDPISISYPRLEVADEEVRILAGELVDKHGVMVCGRGSFTPEFRDAITQLAERLGCPIFADPLSGLRYGSHCRSHILTRYDAYLRTERLVNERRPDWIMRFGATPVSKALQRYLNGAKSAWHWVVTPFNPWPDPDHLADRVIRADPAALCQALLDTPLEPDDRDWLAHFLAEEQRVARVESTHSLPLEAQVMQVLTQLCPGNTRIFAGNSMVIRDVDSFMSGGDPGLVFLGNRGASGIDGNVSTTLGIAAACAHPVVGLLGDLALYHDMNALLAARGITATLIVFNNGGGGIFEYLPQAELPQFERYWLTPTSLDLEQVARLYGLGYQRVSNAEDFRHAVGQSLNSNTTDLIEVSVDRQQSVALHKAYWEAVVAQTDF